MNDLPTSLTQEQSIIFLHIPKTAGTTISNIIQRSYPQNAIFSNYEIYPELYGLELKKIPKVKRKQFQLIQGHLYFGIHEVLPQPCTYFTLLRDPVERVISDYYYIRSYKKHPFNQTLISQQMSLEDLIIRGEYHPDNCQTRFLSGAGKSVPHGQCTQDLLELAKKNLREHFSVVGIVEEFDKTLLLLQKNFGWKNISYTIQNKNKKRLLKENLSQKTLSVIQDYNQLDLELYDYAKEQFQKLVACQGSSFEKELEEFKSMNMSVYGKISAISSSVMSRIKKKIFVYTTLQNE
jgi:hypothetical protein